MQKTNAELRKEARAALEGFWGASIGATLIYMLITCSVPFAIPLIDADNQAGSLWSIVCIPLGWGYCIFFLDLLRKRDTNLGTLFDGYKDFGRIFLTLLLQTIYLILWSLLLIVPGIIKGCSYAMTSFILRDHPELKYHAAIMESERLMKGHKMKLFLLYLSFIGWAILCLLTLGFGFILLYPYVQTSLAAFYQDLINEDTIAHSTHQETTPTEITI